MPGSEETYDVVIIGGGPGGYVCAIRAAQLGLKTALVEKDELGGVCLNRGCIPTKALLQNATLVDLIKRQASEFGLTFDGFKADYSVAVQRSRRVVKRLVTGVGALMRKNKITVVKGEGRLVARDRVHVQGKEEVELRAQHIIVATGSHAWSLPHIEIDGERVLNSDHALMLSSPPASMVIMGAGAVGVEFATIFNSYGTQVILVEMLPRVLPLEDEEISQTLERALSKAGIEVRTGTKVESVETADDGVLVHVTSANGSETLQGEKLLVAIGRAPNSANLGLEDLGVVLDRGFIQVDQYMRTNVPGIYAIGDVTGRQMLAHKAMHEGIVAAEHIAGEEPVPVNYDNIPNCVYCHPQVASVGMTEAQAREAGYDVRIGKFPFQASGRALAGGDYQGYVKLVVDGRYGEILGAHIIGPEATELIHEFVLARAAELTPAEVSGAVHAHPTLAEAVAEAALAAEGRGIHF